MLDSTVLESRLRALVAWATTHGRVVLSIALRGAVQLLLSFIFSVFLYRALYQARPTRRLPPPVPPTSATATVRVQALVPQTELTFPLHFGLCDRHVDVDASAQRAERVARVQLSEGQWHGGREVPAPSGGYHYSAHLCMTLPESPPNEAAGMLGA